MFPRIGHEPHVEDPERFAQLLRDFQHRVTPTDDSPAVSHALAIGCLIPKLTNLTRRETNAATTTIKATAKAPAKEAPAKKTAAPQGTC